MNLFILLWTLFLCLPLLHADEQPDTVPNAWWDPIEEHPAVDKFEEVVEYIGAQNGWCFANLAEIRAADDVALRSAKA